MKRHAFVARPVRWRFGTLFAAATTVELVNTDRPNTWLVMGHDPAGHARCTWIRPDHLIPDPLPHLTLEEA